MAEEKNIAFPQNLSLEDRKKLCVTGVTDIGSYDEQTVIAETELGELTIKGTGLHIIKMSVDMGELAVEGEITSLVYTDVPAESRGLFARLFK